MQIVESQVLAQLSISRHVRTDHCRVQSCYSVFNSVKESHVGLETAVQCGLVA
jgi:hypothetical protein